MRAAPAVSVDASDGGLGRAAVAGLGALAAAVTLHWAWSWLSVPLEALASLRAGGVAVAALGALAVGSFAWHGPRRTLRLAWDGATWHWQADGDAPLRGRVRVVFDLGRWLLLAFDPDPAPQAPGSRRDRPWPRRPARRWRLVADAAVHAARPALYAAAVPARPDARA